MFFCIERHILDSKGSFECEDIRVVFLQSICGRNLFVMSAAGYIGLIFCVYEKNFLMILKEFFRCIYNVFSFTFLCAGLYNRTHFAHEYEKHKRLLSLKK